MALPFILGLALGAGAVVAFNKSSTLKEGACKVLDKSKEFASSSLEKSKDLACEVKNKISSSSCEAETVLEEKEEKSILEEPKKRVRKTKVKEED